MTSTHPLPPHLERFLREQLASGRFHSEGEVIRAALELLEEHSTSQRPFAVWRKPASEGTAGSTPSAPTGRRLSADALPSGIPPARTDGRRSPRGIFADLKSDLSFDEIREARSELWSGFLRGAP